MQGVLLAGLFILNFKKIFLKIKIGEIIAENPLKILILKILMSKIIKDFFTLNAERELRRDSL